MVKFLSRYILCRIMMQVIHLIISEWLTFLIMMKDEQRSGQCNTSLNFNYVYQSISRVKLLIFPLISSLHMVHAMWTSCVFNHCNLLRYWVKAKFCNFWTILNWNDKIFLLSAFKFWRLNVCIDIHTHIHTLESHVTEWHREGKIEKTKIWITKLYPWFFMNTWITE